MQHEPCLVRSRLRQLMCWIRRDRQILLSWFRGVFFRLVLGLMIVAVYLLVACRGPPHRMQKLHWWDYSVCRRWSGVQQIVFWFWRRCQSRFLVHRPLAISWPRSGVSPERCYVNNNCVRWVDDKCKQRRCAAVSGWMCYHLCWKTYRVYTGLLKV